MSDTTDMIEEGFDRARWHREDEGEQDVFDAETLPPLDDEGAVYVIKRLTQFQNEIATVTENAKTMIAQLQADMGRFLLWEDREGRLKTWTAGQLKSKRRTVTTLTGSVGWRAVGAKCSVEDTEQAIAYLREFCPEALALKVVVAKLPKPLEVLDTDTGAVSWVAPVGSGLKAHEATDAFTVNGKMLKTVGEKEDVNE